MNIQARKLNLIKNLILFKDDIILSKIENFFASLAQKKNETEKVKKNILSVSIWSDKDIESLENNLKNFIA